VAAAVAAGRPSQRSDQVRLVVVRIRMALEPGCWVLGGRFTADYEISGCVSLCSMGGQGTPLRGRGVNHVPAGRYVPAASEIDLGGTGAAVGGEHTARLRSRAHDPQADRLLEHGNAGK
jgi:hypothetical protein